MTLIVYCYHHHDIPALYRSLIISPLLCELKSSQILHRLARALTLNLLEVFCNLLMVS